MVLTSIIERLHAAGLQVEAIDGRLRVTPASRITPEITDTIKRHKAEIVAELSAPTPTFPSEDQFFEERAAIREYDGGLSREDAEILADHDCLDLATAGRKRSRAGPIQTVGGSLLICTLPGQTVP